MKKILIIEDQAVMRKNLAFILQMEGFEVHAAANGREGIAMAETLKPDLILCDVMMPVMDGHAVLAALRAKREFAMTPFLFLTARGDREEVRSGMNRGADDYLTKPVVHAELMAAVRSRLDRASAIRQAVKQTPDFGNLEQLQKRFGLTRREAETLSWLAQGKTNADIAVLLNMTERTVKHHVGRCFEKMHCENRSTATLLTIEALSEGGWI